MLNNVTEVDKEVANRLSQSLIIIVLDKTLSISELEYVIDMTCKRKSLGPDRVHPEIEKRGTSILVQGLYDIITKACIK